MRYLEKIVKWGQEKTWLKYYTKLKLWLRTTTTGKLIDRAVRFFVITAVTTFFANYAFGQEVIPVIQSSLAVAGIALYDKAKNEWFAKIRESEEITRL